VVKNGVDDAAELMGVEVQYQAPQTFDMVAMAQLIDAAVAARPDGLVVSIPDADALGHSIQAAVAAGIPVISMGPCSSPRDTAKEVIELSAQATADPSRGGRSPTSVAQLPRREVVCREVVEEPLGSGAGSPASISTLLTCSIRSTSGIDRLQLVEVHAALDS